MSSYLLTIEYEATFEGEPGVTLWGVPEEELESRLAVERIDHQFIGAGTALSTGMRDASIEVYRTNREHLQRALDLCQHGSKWKVEEIA